MAFLEQPAAGSKATTPVTRTQPDPMAHQGNPRPKQALRQLFRVVTSKQDLNLFTKETAPLLIYILMYWKSIFSSTNLRTLCNKALNKIKSNALLSAVNNKLSTTSGLSLNTGLPKTQA